MAHGSWEDPIGKGPSSRPTNSKLDTNAAKFRL